jgi:hypothetical protein
MKLYLAKVQMFGKDPIKEIEEIEVTDSPANYMYMKTKRFSKNKVGILDTKFVEDKSNLFERHSHYLTLVEAEAGITDMISLAIAHFSNIQEKSLISLNSMKDDNFNNSKITLKKS